MDATLPIDRTISGLISQHGVTRTEREWLSLFADAIHFLVT